MAYQLPPALFAQRCPGGMAAAPALVLLVCLERGEGALQSRCWCPALPPQGAQGCWPEETGG